MIHVVEPKVLALPISILSSNNEHSDNLVYAPLQPVREVEIVHSFKEANDSDMSVEETNMVRFKTLGQKKTMLTITPPVVVAPPVIQVPPPTTDPIMTLDATVTGLAEANLRPRFLANKRGRKL